MGKRTVGGKPVDYYGKKTGTKRSDRHWTAPDGELWDSRYEYLVYIKHRQEGINIQRCDKRDSFSFTLPIRGGSCRSCGSVEVGQRRTFTPDFRVVSEDREHPVVEYYIEAKGYIRAKERSLLRHFNKEYPDTDVRFILQNNHRVTKPSKTSEGRLVDWFNKFMKGKKHYVWSGAIKNESKTSESTAESSKKVRVRTKHTRGK
jgi:hypothetical protein